MLTAPLIDYIKSITTGFTALLFFISSIGLFLFYRKDKSDQEFTKEATIGRYGSVTYIVVSIILIVTKFFID